MHKYNQQAHLLLLLALGWHLSLLVAAHCQLAEQYQQPQGQLQHQVMLEVRLPGLGLPQFGLSVVGWRQQHQVIPAHLLELRLGQWQGVPHL
jgi:hypothetical protein